MMDKINFFTIYEYITHLINKNYYTIHKYFVLYRYVCSWKILMKKNSIVDAENRLVH